MPRVRVPPLLCALLPALLLVPTLGSSLARVVPLV